MDEAEAEFTYSIMRTGELVMPRKKRKRAGRRWSGDAQRKAEPEMTGKDMHTTCHNIKAGTKDTELQKVVCRACKKVKTRAATVICFSGDMFRKWRSSYPGMIREGSSKHRIPMEMAETRKKVNTRCIHYEDGRLLRDKDFVTQRWERSFYPLLNAKAEKQNLGIISKLPQQTNEDNLGVEPTEGDVAVALQAMN